ncbi:MAG TPA: glycosyltransferase [Bacteroidales bacterium]|nr:glycosyltransferase [Bacteroidales bacterium]
MTKILIGPAYPLRGGIADFNQALAQSYQPDHKVKIYTFSLQYPGFLFPGKTQFAEGGQPDNIPTDVSINSINPFNWIKIGNRIARENPEQVIIHYWMPFMAPCLGTIAKQIKKNSNAKIIGIMHNVIPHENFPFKNPLTKYFVSHCDGFIAMSKSVLKDLEQFTNNPTKKFIPHPIYNTFGEIISKEQSLKKLNLSADYRYLLFFGIIRKYKGLDILIKALADKRLSKFPIKLMVAGEFYEERKVYDDLVAKHHLEDRIIFTHGFVPADKVKYYFCASDIIVQTYKSATQSGVTQIAYHFERPMLVTNVGGLAEIVPHRRVGYVTAINPESVADALIDFFENQREEEFSKNAAIEKDKFSWDQFIKGINEL